MARRRAAAGLLALAVLVSLASRCLAQTYIEPSQLDLGARCEPFAETNVNCRGVVPLGAMIYLNSSTTQASADAFATTQAGPQIPNQR